MVQNRHSHCRRITGSYVCLIDRAFADLPVTVKAIMETILSKKEASPEELLNDMPPPMVVQKVISVRSDD